MHLVRPMPIRITRFRVFTHFLYFNTLLGFTQVLLTNILKEIYAISKYICFTHILLNVLKEVKNRHVLCVGFLILLNCFKQHFAEYLWVAVAFQFLHTFAKESHKSLFFTALIVCNRLLVCRNNGIDNVLNLACIV